MEVGSTFNRRSGFGFPTQKVMDALTAKIQSTFTDTIPTNEDYLNNISKITGIQHVDYSANKPVYSWLQKIGAAIFGPDDPNGGKSADATVTGKPNKWNIYVPIVLLVAAVFLIF